jgi:SCY1-like protein 1
MLHPPSPSNLDANTKQTRQKVLTAAFTRSLRDPFLHARNAALLALSAACDLFNETDCATKLVPAIASVLVDKEKVVRTQAQKTLDLYLARIRILTANYPDTEQAPAVADAATVVPGREEAGSWAGWAISSFTKKVASGDISRGKSPLPPTEDRPSSAPVADAPVRPAPRMAASTNALQSAAAQEPAGFLEEDDDDVDGWGALDEPPPQPRESQPTTVADSWGQSVSAQNGPVRNTLGTSTKPSGVSQFGPKPFTLAEEEVDFEALVGGRKKSVPLPKGLGKKAPIKRTAPVKKAAAAKIEKKKAWDDEEGDWGEGW